jgi:hypothetical protein
LTKIKLRISDANVFIPLIGPQWMRSLEHILQTGGEDYVALEIELALQHGSRATVIPVLVDEVETPKAARLPMAIRKLSSRQAWHLRQKHAGEDIEHLISRIVALQGQAEGEGN